MKPSLNRSVERALRLLEILSWADSPMGTRELARSAGIPVSAAHRLLATLERHGFVNQYPESEKYTLGGKILELSARYLERVDLRHVALPIMRQIRDRCDETVSLFVVDGLERVCIESLESRQSVRRVLGVGTRLPLYAGASGKLLLAYLPEERRRVLLESPLRAFTAKTIVDSARLREELEQIRRQGYARSVGERIPDAASVAAPIWDATGNVVAALTISVPLMRFDEAREHFLTELVRWGATEVSARLGANKKRVHTGSIARGNELPLQARPGLGSQ